MLFLSAERRNPTSAESSRTTAISVSHQPNVVPATPSKIVWYAIMTTAKPTINATARKRALLFGAAGLTSKDGGRKTNPMTRIDERCEKTR